MATPRETPAPGTDFAGTVIVLLRERDKQGPEFGDLREQAKEEGLGRLLELLQGESLRATRTERLLPTDEPLALREAERASRDTPFPALRSLTRYWRIDTRASRVPLDELVARLRQLDEVELAYAELAVTDPSADVGTNPLRVKQGYLERAPGGIDVVWARGRLGGRGAEVGLVDVEQAWRVTHEEYGGVPPELICNIDRDGIDLVGNHGNSTLAVIGAADNNVGIIGIAPRIHCMRRASHYREDAADRKKGLPPVPHVAEAITKAAAVMTAGDVLVLEVQKSLLPAEVQFAEFDAIRHACSKQIVVVEAAGNGKVDLDAVPPAGPDPAAIRWWFEHAKPDDDSGAILVGAAAAALCVHGNGHARWIDHDDPNHVFGSNFGSRVHCHAWGEGVVTALAQGYSPPAFGGTSSATAIVAGTAVLVQAMHGAATGGARLTPTALRDVLADPALGTAQCPAVAGHIGAMPDLAKIGTDPRVGSVAGP